MAFVVDVSVKCMSLEFSAKGLICSGVSDRLLEGFGLDLQTFGVDESCCGIKNIISTIRN